MRVHALFLSCLTLLLVGCGEEKTETVETPPRAIKHMTIGDLAGEEQRKFAGFVKAGTRANVAFELGGQIVELSAKVGDDIKKGQVLAKLDPKPFELEVKQAEYSLEQAQASLEDTTNKFDQQKKLWEQRFSTRTAFDTAKANMRNAEGQVGIATSQLELKKRDLAKTTLKAPFAGKVAKREVDSFEEVTAGQAIYVLQSEGEYEVEVSIPENLLPRIKVGKRAEVTFPPLKGAKSDGIVTEVSPLAGDANAFPVTIRLTASPEGLRPGMSAEINFSFESEATGKAFSVPVGALKPNINAEGALVYLFDAETGTVRERSVKVVGIDGNNPQVVGELKAGDIIATAGVGYMFDGMKVRLLESALPKGGQ